MVPDTPTKFLSKFVATYEKLFKGLAPHEISPHESPAQFWANLLSLNVDKAYLGRKFREIGKEELLAYQKPFLNTLFSTCLFHFRSARYGDSKKANAVDTLSVVVRCCLQKQLAGWEVMELFASGVAESDAVFLDMMDTVEAVLSDSDAPLDIRHKVLQFAVVFACSINQLSPGAYLLRRDLFPSIAKIIKTPETQQYTFEAALLLSVLANFHRTDAAKLNPYLRAISEVEDRDMLKTLCYSANFTMDAVVKSYQDIHDDSPPTFSSSMSNFLSAFRPDRALSATPIDTPKELFKNQPPESTLILLPVHDFIHLNPVFNAVLLEPLISPPEESSDSKTDLPPLICTLISMSSYLLSHASSISVPRAVAYASLSLGTFLHLVENDVAMSAFLQPSPKPIRLCRQRLPTLPVGASTRPVLCAILDCCILWLRHNLHKRFEAQSYLTCIWIVHRVLWFLSKTRRRIEFHWEELWKSFISLLDFLSSKVNTSSGKSEQLVQEMVIILAFSLRHAEAYLGSPQSVHQLVYELVRSAEILVKQQEVCKQQRRRTSFKAGRNTMSAGDSLKLILDIVSHYEKKVQESGSKSAVAVLKTISKEIDRDGLFGGKDMNEDDPPKYSDELGELGFARFACIDGLALMPGPDTS